MIILDMKNGFAWSHFESIEEFRDYMQYLERKGAYPTKIIDQIQELYEELFATFGIEKILVRRFGDLLIGLGTPYFRLSMRSRDLLCPVQIEQGHWADGETV